MNETEKIFAAAFLAAATLDKYAKKFYTEMDVCVEVNRHERKA